MRRIQSKRGTVEMMVPQLFSHLIVGLKIGGVTDLHHLVIRLL